PWGTRSSWTRASAVAGPDRSSTSQRPRSTLAAYAPSTTQSTKNGATANQRVVLQRRDGVVSGGSPPRSLDLASDSSRVLAASLSMSAESIRFGAIETSAPDASSEVEESSGSGARSRLEKNTSVGPVSSELGASAAASSPSPRPGTSRSV